MAQLDLKEIKAFVPAKDFEVSKAFYEALGFTKASDAQGIAYFFFGGCSFLLQDFYIKEHAENFMLHFLVEDVYTWREKILRSGVIDNYHTKVTEITEQPWNMLDFMVIDPSGVLLRFGQNV